MERLTCVCRLGIGEPEVAVAVDVQVVEAQEGLRIVVVQDDFFGEAGRVDLHERAGFFVAVTVGDDVHGAVVDDAAMGVYGGGLRLDLRERVVQRVEEVLPGMGAVVATR